MKFLYFFRTKRTMNQSKFKILMYFGMYIRWSNSEIAETFYRPKMLSNDNLRFWVGGKQWFAKLRDSKCF